MYAFRASGSLYFPGFLFLLATALATGFVLATGLLTLQTCAWYDSWRSPQSGQRGFIGSKKCGRGRANAFALALGGWWGPGPLPILWISHLT
jgi:hypothetical protein